MTDDHQTQEFVRGHPPLERIVTRFTMPFNETLRIALGGHQVRHPRAPSTLARFADPRFRSTSPGWYLKVRVSMGVRPSCFATCPTSSSNSPSSQSRRLRSFPLVSRRLLWTVPATDGVAARGAAQTGLPQSSASSGSDWLFWFGRGLRRRSGRLIPALPLRRFLLAHRPPQPNSPSSPAASLPQETLVSLLRPGP